MSGDFRITLDAIKVPRTYLETLLSQWIEAYEAARKTPGADDLGHPALVKMNAKNLAGYVGDHFDFIYTAVAGELIKQACLQAYSAGLGRPMPVFVIGPETPTPKPHPSRAVQRVERDPDTLEVTRTVTEYE